MKLKTSLNLVMSIILMLPLLAFSDVKISSKFGTGLIFSDKKSGQHYYNDAWGKLTFYSHDESIDLSINNRYFNEDGSSTLSPSGKYLIVNSVSGGVLDDGDGGQEYVDRAHCSIVDMKSGCYVSDWEGEACGYSWKKMRMY